MEQAKGSKHCTLEQKNPNPGYCPQAGQRYLHYKHYSTVTPRPMAFCDTRHSRKGGAFQTKGTCRVFEVKAGISPASVLAEAV